jgi:hypothetical protein
VNFPRLRGAWVLIAIVAGWALVVVSQPMGLWWMAVVCGVGLGLLVPGWRAGVGALLVGLLGWGIPLLWQARNTPVDTVAGVLGGLLGVPAAAAVVLTLLVSVLLALVGAWLGIAVRRALSQKPGPAPPPSSTSDGS